MRKPGECLMLRAPLCGTRVRFVDLFEFGEYLGIEESTTGTVIVNSTEFGVRVRWDDGREISVWGECLEAEPRWTREPAKATP